MSDNGDSAGMLIVTGTLSVPPDALACFMAELSELARSTRTREGNLSYDTAVLNAVTGELLVAERWRDEAALAAHLLAVETVAFVSRWAGQLRGDVRLYDAGNERPLAANQDASRLWYVTSTA